MSSPEFLSHHPEPPAIPPTYRRQTLKTKPITKCGRTIYINGQTDKTQNN